MDQNQLPDTPCPKKLRQSYTISQKLSAIQVLQVKQTSNTPNALVETANELGIHKSMISKWNKEQLKLTEANKSRIRKLSITWAATEI